MGRLLLAAALAATTSSLALAEPARTEGPPLGLRKGAGTEAVDRATTSGIALRQSLGELPGLPVADGQIERPREALVLTVRPPHALRGTTAGEGSISEAAWVAIQESDLVKAANAEKRAAQAAVSRASAAFFPVVSATGFAGRRIETGSGTTADGGDSYSAAISVGLPLLDGGQRYFARQSAGSRALAAGAELRQASEAVALQAIETAIDLNLSEHQSRVLRETLRDLSALRSAVQSRIDAGQAADGDAAELEAELSEIAGTVVAAKAQADAARARLSDQLRQTVPGRFAMPDFDAVPARGLDGLLALVRRNNAGIEAGWHRYDAADASSKAAAGKYLPRLDLKADYRTTRGYASDTNDDGLSVGVQLAVPLLDLSTTAEVRETRELARAAMHRAMASERDAETQLRLDWVAYQSAGERARLAGAKVASLRRAYAAKVAQYRAGLVSVDDVLYTRRRLALASSEHIEAAGRRQAAIARLGAAAGLLDEMIGDAPSAR